MKKKLSFSELGFGFLGFQVFLRFCG